MAHGADPLPDFSSGLGPYPILQFFGGLLVFGTTALMYVRGQRKPGNTVEQTEVYLDGPLAHAVKVLERIAAASEQSVPARQEIAELKERYEGALAETRRTVYARLEAFGDRIGVCERDCAVLKDRPRTRQ